MNIEVCFTPDEYKTEDYEKFTAVVIDVLRATTSIATAFSNGCRQIVPVEQVNQAFQKKEQLYPEAILAGERNGLLISGFNLGNSPLEYGRDMVKEKTIIMTTTNGTMALNKAASAQKVYAAAFVNGMAICSKLIEEKRSVVILCAGTEGRFSVEDALCAGLIVDRLQDHYHLSDKALAVQAMYEAYKSHLVARVGQSSHALYLTELGFADDVKLCLQHDVFNLAPVFANGVLTL